MKKISLAMPLDVMRWFLCFCFGCFTYLLLAYFYGNSGVYAQLALIEYHEKLEAHVKELEQTQNLLEEELASLYYSEEDLKLQARKLGYFSPDDLVFYFSLPTESRAFYREASAPIVRVPYRLFSNSFFYIATFFAIFLFYMGWGLVANVFGTTLRLKGVWMEFKKRTHHLLRKIGHLTRPKL